MNYGKAGWPMNLFPGICIWSERSQKWERKNCGVSCQANANIYSKSSQFQKFNNLYFEYEFEAQDKVLLIGFRFFSPIIILTLIQIF